MVLHKIYVKVLRDLRRGVLHESFIRDLNQIERS